MDGDVLLDRESGRYTQDIVEWYYGIICSSNGMGMVITTITIQSPNG